MISGLKSSIIGNARFSSALTTSLSPAPKLNGIGMLNPCPSFSPISSINP